MRMNNPAYALIGETRHDRGQSITLRIGPAFHAYLGAMAADNGRSLSDEIRAAIEVHVCLHRLSLILDQDTQNWRKDVSDGLFGTTGESARGMAELLRREVAAIWTESFPSAFAIFKDDFPEFLWRAEI